MNRPLTIHMHQSLSRMKIYTFKLYKNKIPKV